MIRSGVPLACAAFQAWNISSSETLAGPSITRPPVSRAKIRPIRLRPDPRGPVSTAVRTGQVET